MRPSISIVVLALLTAVSVVSPAARATEPSLPRHVLAQSRHQLEVTVLSVESKAQHEQLTNVWHRVRIDRVMAGEGLKPGDETAVVSQVRTYATPTPGGTGHRANFGGVNGLPRKGDRARLFASGTSAILQPRSPNGWQPLERTTCLLISAESSGADGLVDVVASMREAGLGSARVLSVPLATSWPWWSFGDGDCTVLLMRDCDPSHIDEPAFMAATGHGMPLVGFRDSARPVRGRETFGREQFGVGGIKDAKAGEGTVILPPSEEASQHPVLAGVTIGASGLTVPGSLRSVSTLDPDCTVLLWGQPATGAKGDATRQPLLWVREVDVAGQPMRRRGAFSTLGEAGDFSNAEVRVMAAQMIAWAMGEESRLSDERRAAIRRAGTGRSEAGPDR
ncbi:MAG: hypothetical protein RL689_220 [Planctomycetota bacterium]|jgi:hypothetical protein